MTREEAIKELERAFDVLDHSCHMDNHRKDAFNMAIEALFVEPCEDAISRQALLEYIEFILTHGMGKKKSFEFIKKFVEKQPSVTPKQKMGHWMLQPSNKDQGERDFIWWKCSECGQVIFSESERDRREFHAYCSRCGAKMSEIPTGSNCTACILDGTDACTRGAGRAVDGRVCEDFVGESEDAE